MCGCEASVVSARESEWASDADEDPTRLLAATGYWNRELLGKTVAFRERITKRLAERLGEEESAPRAASIMSHPRL